MMMTGVAMPSAAIHSSSSVPSASGRRMSQSTRRNAPSESLRRAASAVDTLSAPKPCFESHVRSISARVMSSSTISMSQRVSFIGPS